MRSCSSLARRATCALLLSACASDEPGPAAASSPLETGDLPSTTSTTTSSGTGSSTGTDPATTSVGSDATASSLGTTSTDTDTAAPESDASTQGAEESGTGDEDGDPRPPGRAFCPPLAIVPPQGPAFDVTPENIASLPTLIADAEPNTTFVFADGTYDLSGLSTLDIQTDGLRFVAASLVRDTVVLEAENGPDEVFVIRANNVTIAHMTVRGATTHAIRVTGADDGDTGNTILYDLTLVDAGGHAIAIHPSPQATYADAGVIACTSIEVTASRRETVPACDLGGIDGEAAAGWEIRDNAISGLWCPQELANPAIQFWSSARDTLIHRNVIVDCAQAIALGSDDWGSDNARAYEDEPCEGNGDISHFDGEVRNNTIFAGASDLFASQEGVMAGLAFTDACGPRVHHNTIVALEGDPPSIEMRGPDTQVDLVNNLATHAITRRNGSGGLLEGNLEDQGLDHFVDGNGGDLQLSPASEAVDAGDPRSLEWVSTDAQGDPRDEEPDVGADELIRG